VARRVDPGRQRLPASGIVATAPAPAPPEPEDKPGRKRVSKAKKRDNALRAQEEHLRAAFEAVCAAQQLTASGAGLTNAPGITTLLMAELENLKQHRAVTAHELLREG